MSSITNNQPIQYQFYTAQVEQAFNSAKNIVEQFKPYSEEILDKAQEKFGTQIENNISNHSSQLPSIFQKT